MRKRECSCIHLPNQKFTCSKGVLIPLENFDEPFDEPFEFSVVPSFEWCKLAIENKNQNGQFEVKLILFPLHDGDFDFKVEIKGKISEKIHTYHFTIAFIPDPKTLWKDLPVPDDSPFKKSVTDVFSFSDDQAEIIAASSRGRSHAHIGTNRDDDMAFWQDREKKSYVFAVADGAGSAKFSCHGSFVAVHSAAEELSVKFTDEVWQQIFEMEDPCLSKGANILTTAALNAAHKIREAADKFAKEKMENASFGVKDFATTLLLTVLKIDSNGVLHGMTFSMGDGAIAWYQPNETLLLCSPDSGEFSGQTRFLTTPSVWPHDGEWDDFFHHRIFSFSAPAEKSGILMLMTDGVSDPFFETEEKLALPEAWDSFYEEIKRSGALDSNTDLPQRSELLRDWLGFWSRGNHDDRTIALFRRKRGS